MRVEDQDSTEQLDAFRDRMRERATTMGAEAGVAYGELFKLIPEL